MFHQRLNSKGGMTEFRTNFVSAEDKADWRVLIDGYADFYAVAMNDEIADRVWTWLLDPSHVLEGLLTRDSNGLAVGIAHVRACPRSLGGYDIGFLDDIFVLPEARGSGAADAMFAALKDIATNRGWPTIRWITQHFNERGRAFYDRYTGGPSDFIMYQWNQE
jgi:GNAT superfamily N-acetyltransferase